MYTKSNEPEPLHAQRGVMRTLKILSREIKFFPRVHEHIFGFLSPPCGIYKSGPRWRKSANDGSKTSCSLLHRSRGLVSVSFHGIKYKKKLWPHLFSLANFESKINSKSPPHGPPSLSFPRRSPDQYLLVNSPHKTFQKENQKYPGVATTEPTPPLTLSARRVAPPTPE